MKYFLPIATVILSLILLSCQDSSNEIVFFIAIDMPEIDLELMGEIISFSEDYDIVVSKTIKDHYEPLFAVYKKNIIHKIENLLNAGARKIIELYPLCKTKFIISKKGKKIINLNTFEEYKNYVKFSSNI